MSIRSALASRRHSRTAIATYQLLVFQSRQEWFALPVNAVHKVIFMGKLFGSSQRTGISLTLYRDRELLVIDLEHRVFGSIESQHLPTSTTEGNINSEVANIEQQSYLLLAPNLEGEIVGLAIKHQPKLRRIPQTAFAPIPPAYVSEGKLRCVNALIIQKPEHPPLFLLDLDQLLQFPLALPQTPK